MQIDLDMMRIDQNLTPYLVTDVSAAEGISQYVLWCKAYPHAENKAKTLGLNHFHLAEITPEDYPDYYDSLAHYVVRIHHKPSHSSWGPVHSDKTILPYDEENPDWYYEGVTVNLDEYGVGRAADDGLPVFRVTIEGDEKWIASVTIYTDGYEDSTDLVSVHDEAFFAYLNVKAALDNLGVKGHIEPEFKPKGSGRGFYGLPSENERMPLKANGGN